MPVHRMGAVEASHLKKVGYVYLDVRAPEEYAKGHPAGAVNVPYQLFGKVGFKDNAQFLPVMEALYATSTKILVIGKIGKRSLRAARVLIGAGYTEVCELRPGYVGLVDDRGRFSEDGWETLGLPCATESELGNYKAMLRKANLPSSNSSQTPAPVSAPPKSHDPPGIRRLSATDAYKLRRIGYVFLDIRAPEEYAKGHPKGAVNMPLKLFGRGGGFKPNKDFLPLMEALYPKDTKLLVVGKIGKRSLEAAEALKAAGYQHLCELRPGVMGIVDNEGHFSEDGWDTLGLVSEKKTDDGSYAELKERAGW